MRGIAQGGRHSADDHDANALWDIYGIKKKRGERSANFFLGGAHYTPSWLGLLANPINRSQRTGGR